jgi:hypothetical protein
MFYPSLTFFNSFSSIIKGNYTFILTAIIFILFFISKYYFEYKTSSNLRRIQFLNENFRKNYKLYLSHWVFQNISIETKYLGTFKEKGNRKYTPEWNGNLKFSLREHYFLSLLFNEKVRPVMHFLQKMHPRHFVYCRPKERHLEFHLSALDTAL